MKDNLGHEITANVSTMAKGQAFNHVPMSMYILKDTTNVRKADYKADTTKFCTFKQ